MTAENLGILHEHYRDSCGVMQAHRIARDRYFYLVLAVQAITLYDLAAPADFASTMAALLQAQLELSIAPNLSYIRSLIWFLLLGLTVRYGQSAINVERQYEYVHRLEAILNKQVGEGFSREGAAYLSNYPPFLQWAHTLYTIVFPLLLSAVVVAWTIKQTPGPPWPIGSGVWAVTDWFNTAVALAILTSITLYLHALHWRDKPTTRHPPR